MARRTMGTKLQSIERCIFRILLLVTMILGAARLFREDIILLLSDQNRPTQPQKLSGSP